MASPELEPLRIAVLPLSLLGPDTSDNYIADGFSEQLISVLARIDGLRVIARASTRSYGGGEKRISEIGHELGAGTILDGSVRRSGDQLRIAFHLIDAESEEHLWSKEFNTGFDRLFEVQTEIAVRIAESLERSIEPVELSRLRRAPTRDMSAYDLYLRGRRAYRQQSRAGNEEAILLYRQALALDPGFALAEAGLANAHALRVVRYGFDEKWREAAEAAAQRRAARPKPHPRS